MPHGFHHDSGPAPQLALSAPAGAPDGADEESDLRAAPGNGSEPQQAAAAQGGLLPGTDFKERRDSGKHPAVAAAQPGDDRTVPENGIRFGEFSTAGSAAGREGPTPQDRSGSGSHHRAHLGTGDWGCIALPVDQASHQLLWAVRRGKELRGQEHAYAAFQATQQTYTTCSGRSRE